MWNSRTVSTHVKCRKVFFIAAHAGESPYEGKYNSMIFQILKCLFDGHAIPLSALSYWCFLHGAIKGKDYVLSNGPFLPKAGYYLTGFVLFGRMSLFSI